MPQVHLAMRVFLGNHWFFDEWNTQWRNLNITLLELYPIVLAVAIWGNQLCSFSH
jgi:hypothetical protein